MRNERYVPMKGRSVMFHHLPKGGNIYGGAVSQLLDSIKKSPQLAKVLAGAGIGANRPVGIISSGSSSSSKQTLSKPVFQGGDLLNSIAFGSSGKAFSKRDNIKFIF